MSGIQRTLSPRARVQRWPGHFSDQVGFTLVEMLIAVAITLVMMAAVVTLFANITESVRSRRATMELGAQLRGVRNVLQQDLQGATCPGVTWQSPDSNHGYLEFIEGVYRDSYPSLLTDGTSTATNPELDAKLSIVPPANAGSITGNVSGLGDYDDILMLTTRNEHEPFIGRMPDYAANSKGFTTLESPLAEVVWFAIENPTERDRARGLFGEPGMRTVYRRALLIAPWIDPYGDLSKNQNPAQPQPQPGVARLLDSTDFPRNNVPRALAALVAFQDEFDLSVRLEWDALAANGSGQWKIVANSLSDLTKRENRFLHHQYHAASGDRRFPYAAASAGTYSGSAPPLTFVSDPMYGAPTGSVSAQATIVQSHVQSYALSTSSYDLTSGRKYKARPFAYLDSNSANDIDATPNVMLNDDGQVVRIVHGPVPLWGKRRGADVMLTDVLAFDLRVYDPGAPLYQNTNTNVIVEPCDAGWRLHYNSQMGNVTTSSTNPATFVGQGAYVDMGYVYDPVNPGAPVAIPFVSSPSPWILPWFAVPREISLSLVPSGVLLTPGYALYDTWSTSYENNGKDDDQDGVIDQGSDGLDSVGRYPGAAANSFVTDTRLGPDDAGERETAPPYDTPLRGVQVLLRVYERDSRQIRQVRVNQHLLTE